MTTTYRASTSARRKQTIVDDVFQTHASHTILLFFGTLPLLAPLQAKQLKDYENAVIAKRLEELDEDEIQALVEEVERDDF